MRRSVYGSSVCALLVALAACDQSVAPASLPDPEPVLPREELVELDQLDTPAPPEPPEPPSEPPAPDPHEDHAFLVSRFGPSQGLPGTRVSILTAFTPNGCYAAGECAVTIGDKAAEVGDDMHLLEVFVPDYAVSGPLCVTWQGRSECAGDFTVLTSPLIYAMTPEGVPVGSGDVVIQLHGDGFLDDAYAMFDWQMLKTVVQDDYTLTAVVPASMLATAGVHTVMVNVPSVNRCGAHSEPVTFIVE